MEPIKILQHYFNIKSFRYKQEEIINSIINKENVLVIMPTGGGKSICYQIPSIIMEGLTIVVTPLISLMQDQVSSLHNLNIPATFINSSLSKNEILQRLQDIQNNCYKLLYMAPEGFKNNFFINILSKIKINFLAIDEVHCISQWGHDFRPEYSRLSTVIQNLGFPNVAAFTATANPQVQEDIILNLKLKKIKKFIQGFARKNLELKAIFTPNESSKFYYLENLIKKYKKGIIYCSTRKHVSKVAKELQSKNYSIVEYHAGLSDKERNYAQELFCNSKVNIAIATNAFGMGINIKDLRFIAHFNMPGSIEAYYQEVGRAGRDGLHSKCEIYYNFPDRKIQEFFIYGNNPTLNTIYSTYTALEELADKDKKIYSSIEEITKKINDKSINAISVSTSISILKKFQIIDRFNIEGSKIKGTIILIPNLSYNNFPINYKYLNDKLNNDMKKFNKLIEYIYLVNICREQFLLEYFGEKKEYNCGKCDICQNIIYKY